MKTDERFHVVTFESNGPSLVGGTLLIDGQKVKGARYVKIEGSIDSTMSVTIEMIANVNCITGASAIVDQSDISDEYRKYAKVEAASGQ